jgi:hypothetical protein
MRSARIKSITSTDPLFASHSHRVDPRPTDETHSRAEVQRLNNAETAERAPVHQDLDLVAHRVGDRGQRVHRRGDAVELTSAVIGHHDRVGAIGARLARVIGVEDPLEHDSAVPE